MAHTYNEINNDYTLVIDFSALSRASLKLTVSRGSDFNISAVRAAESPKGPSPTTFLVVPVIASTKASTSSFDFDSTSSNFLVKSMMDRPATRATMGLRHAAEHKLKAAPF
mmetsp:Transcript_18820/g.32365  ORF Transcript_18820/g.32365 Transcript_18820/m.32365 type:complete len:111 (+) Transcript_18820:437-769(+)